MSLPNDGVLRSPGVLLYDHSRPVQVLDLGEDIFGIARALAGDPGGDKVNAPVREAARAGSWELMDVFSFLATPYGNDYNEMMSHGDRFLDSSWLD